MTLNCQPALHSRREGGGYLIEAAARQVWRQGGGSTAEGLHQGGGGAACNQGGDLMHPGGGVSYPLKTILAEPDSEPQGGFLSGKAGRKAIRLRLSLYHAKAS
jgi:hypothetical protein